MADVFLSSDITRVLDNKYVVIIGDSVQRSIYKDLVCMLQENKYMSDTQLRCKGDLNFQNDVLLEGGKLGKMNNGIEYREEREYHTDHHLVKFYFVTRCYNPYMERVLDAIHKQPVPPDVVILNSSVWDISRYGPSAVPKFMENMKTLAKKLKTVLPEACLVIWNTTLPISDKARGGFLIPDVEYMTSSLHLDILQANYYARNVMNEAGFDVLDIHYHLRHQIHRRAEDGIHWDMTAHRHITNLLLTHISEAWGRSLPGNVDEYMKTSGSHRLISMTDHQANNNMPVPANIAKRPKAIPRRRMSPKKSNASSHTCTSETVSRNNMTDFSTASFEVPVNNFGGVSCSPNMNLPSMVNPFERYRGPINSSPYHSSLPPTGMFNGNVSRQPSTAHQNPGFMRNNLTSMPPFHRPEGMWTQQRPMLSPYHMMPQKMRNQFHE